MAQWPIGGELRRIPGVMMAAMLLALTACGSNEDPSAAAPDDTAPAGGQEGEAATRRADESVAAVLQSQGTPLATLRFTVTDRPVAGQAFPMQLSVSAAQPVESLQLQVESADLIATPGQAELLLDETQAPVIREFALTAAEAGLVELTVRLSSDGSGPETVYAIPVLVAEAP